MDVRTTRRSVGWWIAAGATSLAVDWLINVALRAHNPLEPALIGIAAVCGLCATYQLGRMHEHRRVMSHLVDFARRGGTIVAVDAPPVDDGGDGT